MWLLFSVWVCCPLTFNTAIPGLLYKVTRVIQSHILLPKTLPSSLDLSLNLYSIDEVEIHVHLPSSSPAKSVSATMVRLVQNLNTAEQSGKNGNSVFKLQNCLVRPMLLDHTILNLWKRRIWDSRIPSLTDRIEFYSNQPVKNLKTLADVNEPLNHLIEPLPKTLLDYWRSSSIEYHVWEIDRFRPLWQVFILLLTMHQNKKLDLLEYKERRPNSSSLNSRTPTMIGYNEEDL